MHKSILPWWREKLGRFRLCDITSALIAQYRDKLVAETYRRACPGAKRSSLKAGELAREFKRQPNTVNNHLVSLGRIFSVARRERHWITHNPMGGSRSSPPSLRSSISASCCPIRSRSSAA